MLQYILDDIKTFLLNVLCVYCIVYYPEHVQMFFTFLTFWYASPGEICTNLCNKNSQSIVAKPIIKQGGDQSKALWQRILIYVCVSVHVCACEHTYTFITKKRLKLDEKVTWKSSRICVFQGQEGVHLLALILLPPLFFFSWSTAISM